MSIKVLLKYKVYDNFKIFGFLKINANKLNLKYKLKCSYNIDLLKSPKFCYKNNAQREEI